jgi:hypothetical protein
MISKNESGSVSRIRPSRGMTRHRQQWGRIGAKLATAVVLAGTLAGSHGASAQVLPGTGNVGSTAPITQFAIAGYIQDFKMTPPRGNPVLAGATMRVNGKNIVIPDNTVVIMPASSNTVYDLFHTAPANKLASVLANSESGLALNDITKPLAPFEAAIVGNIVNGQYIAGLVNIAQEFVQLHQGYISYIDYASGDLCVDANTLPPAPLVNPARVGPGCLATEMRVKLNDPGGRYGKQRTEGDQDPRFVVDDANPSIRAVTGYPMCIPRVAPPAIDAVCPITNRPIETTTRRPLTRFVMDTVDLPPVVPGAVAVAGFTDIPSCRKGLILGVLGRDCNSTQQVPFMVGDFLEAIQGTMGQDSSPVNNGSFLSAYGVIATAGIYTKPCGTYGGVNAVTDPTGAIAGNGTPNKKCNPFTDITYMQYEVGLIGTVGTNLNVANVEGQDRIKIVGFTTDPTRQVEVYGVDTDGNLRWIANIVPERIPFGRFTLFVQRDIVKSLPLATTGGPIPIVDNHLGVDLGAPRNFYVHMAKSEALLGGKQRPHNVKPIPGVCGGLLFAGCPGLNGTAVPTPADIVNPASIDPKTGQPRVITIANGLVPSQYLAPIQEYIFEENTQIGDPWIPANFECLDFLVKGSKMSTPSLAAAGLPGVGQLNPWPGGVLNGAIAPPATQAGVACAAR